MSNETLYVQKHFRDANGAMRDAPQVVKPDEYSKSTLDWYLSKGMVGPEFPEGFSVEDLEGEVDELDQGTEDSSAGGGGDAESQAEGDSSATESEGDSPSGDQGAGEAVTDDKVE